ncbi:MAG: hypothetical protein ACD_5C00075G0006 [uncultured bacterium]|nr:MAG: hypothetical protein ACD_5C00075G0006 [uncultured bacterium]
MKQKFYSWILKKIIKDKYPKCSLSGDYRVERHKNGYHIIL